MEQVKINSDDQVPDELIAEFKVDWKRKRQQGTLSKFKTGVIESNKKLARELMKCWQCDKPGHRMAECLDLVAKRKIVVNVLLYYDSND